MKDGKQENTSVSNAETSQPTYGQLAEMSRKELRAIAKEKGYKKYHAHRKEELAEWIDTGIDPREQQGKVGLGDVTETAIQFATLGTGKLIAKAYTKLTGKDCGCEERKDLLNKTGQELLSMFFKGGKLRCLNSQEKAMLSEIEIYQKNGLPSIKSRYTPAQITGLYNAVTGLRQPTPTCKCQTTINTLIEFVNRLNGINEMCEAGHKPK